MSSATIIHTTKHCKPALIDYPKIGVGQLMKSLMPKDDKRSSGANGPDPFWLTRDESEVAKGIDGNIKCSVDKKTNVITITVTDQDPLVAALMADSVKNHLQVAITDYKTKKARVDLDYMQKLFGEARAQYDKARQVYAAYADANQEVALQSYKLKEEDLENDMQLKYNIYQQVVEQLQLAKAKVQERTPAFTVVEELVCRCATAVGRNWPRWSCGCSWDLPCVWAFWHGVTEGSSSLCKFRH